MTRADAWIHFASAAFLGSSFGSSAEEMAEVADEFLVEFDRRFEPVPYGDGQAPLGTASDTFQVRDHEG